MQYITLVIRAVAIVVCGILMALDQVVEIVDQTLDRAYYPRKPESQPEWQKYLDRAYYSSKPESQPYDPDAIE